MQNPKKQIQTSQKTEKPKTAKKGKIAEVNNLAHKGSSVKEISEKMGLSERVVRAYLWRAKNPEKFKKLLDRYNEKRKKKLAEKTNQVGPSEKQGQSTKEKE